ncbi:MAG: FAD-binding oxidoreductase [Pseudonocardia sp.]|nr:FAD-binding oxidoreductase [Pseudonocardia sp.]
MRSRYARLPDGGQVRLGKPTSNLFRFRADAAPASRLDVTGLDRVLSIDSATRTAFVQGMTTYERLVEATLARQLMPLVVPQLKTITMGGAVAGLGIESSSFRHGLAHESVLEMEVLTGDGQLVTATADNEHAALFRALPNSYGTLGYTVALRIQLQPVRRFVALRHVRFGDATSCADAIAEICDAGAYRGEPVDFCDGTVFGAGEQYLTLGRFTDIVSHSTRPSDYTGQRIYYRSIQARADDLMTTRDYLWRWDTDWFWCSRALGAQNPVLRRLWPRRYRRSDVYRRLVALDRRYRLSAKVRRRAGIPPEEPVIQDIQVPVRRLAEFLAVFHAEVGITPVWLCPVQLADPAGWPLYPMDPSRRYVNVGFWSAVPLADGEPNGTHNRRIERLVADLDGHKSLYSDAYYPEGEFWDRYNGPEYHAVKQVYDPDGRLPNLYDKCVRGR